MLVYLWRRIAFTLARELDCGARERLNIVRFEYESWRSEAVDDGDVSAY